MCDFCERLWRVVEATIRKSQFGQGARLSQSEIDRLVEFSLDELAEKIVKRFEGRK